MSASKASVLLVDDVEANLLALEGLLSCMGCNLVRARSGNDALRELMKNEFALVLLDVQMPGMDGYEVARLARSHGSTRHVPIIFLTAKQDTEASMMRGYGSGAVDFLLKPINAQVLRAKVHVFLDLYHSRQTIAREAAAHEQTSEQLQHARSALRLLTQVMTQGVRGPLRTLRASLDGPQQERARKAVQSMESLLDRLATYASLSDAPVRTPVELGRVVQQVVTDLKPRIVASGAEISVSELPQIAADPERMHCLFLQLLDNALKFAEPGMSPKVKVHASLQRGQPVIYVEDRGMGIDKEDHAKIFEALKRRHEGTPLEGAGLGLAICKQIVQQHGGRIELESERGYGARFILRFDRGTMKEASTAARSN